MSSILAYFFFFFTLLFLVHGEEKFYKNQENVNLSFVSSEQTIPDHRLGHRVRQQSGSLFQST